MKIIIIISRIVFALALFSSAISVYGQTITGQSPALVGSTYTYTCTKSTVWPSPQVWEPTGGTLISHTISTDKKTITAIVKWTQAVDFSGGDFYSTLNLSAGSLNLHAVIEVVCSASSRPQDPTYLVAAPGNVSYTPKSFSIAINNTILGVVYKWFYNATDETPFQTGLSLTTPVITASTTYYVCTYNPTSNCNSNRISIPLKIVPAPPQPAPPTYEVIRNLCGSVSAVINVIPSGTGNGVKRYSSPTGGDPGIPALTSPTTFYAVTYDPINGAESFPRTPIEVIAYPAPASSQGPLKPYVPFSKTVYKEGTVDLEATAVGGIIYWYSTQTGGTPLATGFYYTTPVLTEPKTYYIATHDTNGCESGRLPVIADLRPVTSALAITIDKVRVGGVKDSTTLVTLNSSQLTTQVSHIDGHLRKNEQILVKGSPAGNDIVQAVEYLDNGKNAKSYLPYVSSTTNGSYQYKYKTNQAAFYGSESVNDKIANDDYPFSLMKTEDSPLGRPLEQSAPGADRQLGSGHTQRVSYSFNTGSTNSLPEEVRRFNADGTSTAFYAINKLNRIEGTDEDGNKQIKFIDGSGNILAVKKQIDATNYLQTYYVYDNFGRVQYIISPKGTAALRSGAWSFTFAIKDNYCTQFVYDYRGRLVEKKTPGQAVVYYVYDRMNRLVLVQDAIQRAANKWMFVKYDMKGRAVMQGLYSNVTQVTRTTVQTLVDGLYIPTNVKYPENAWYENRGATLHGYTNISFPIDNSDGSPLDMKNVVYYESYDFDYNGSRDYKYDSLTFNGQATWSNYRAKDLPTGSKRLIVGTSNWLYTYIYYDDRGNAVQARTNNHLSPVVDNLTTNVYDFEGKVLARKVYHNAGTGKQTTVVNRYDYDAQGRIKKIYQNNNSAAADQLVVAYEYNELGQLVDKKLHGNDPVNPTSYVQSVDYRFDILGQLLSVNNTQLTNDGDINDDTNDYFGMELAYNVGAGMGNAVSYSGNISAMKWNGVNSPIGTPTVKSYKYDYDKSGRLKTATSQMYTGSAWTKEVNALNESMTYDENGNIKTLLRNQRKYQSVGNLGSYTSETMDNLTYTYNATIGDRLDKVTDAATPVLPGGFDNGASSTNTDYTYDLTGNGSIISDLNKGISGIVYNYLGKPDVINFSDGRHINYVYDAAGTKLTMKTYDKSNTLKTTTDYVNGFVYENNVLSFFSTAEGRVVKKGTTLEYQYAIADHEGNTRVVFTSAAPTVVTSKATFETDESSQFDSYPSGGSINHLPTNNSTTPGTNSQYLNGGYNGMVGVSKSYKVYPGDQVKIDAYARYNAPATNNSNLTSFATALLGAFQILPPLPGEVGTAGSALNSFGSLAAGGYGDGSIDNIDPKAFVTILLFDKNYNFLDVTFSQVKSSGAPTLISANYTVKEAGYAYVYISNENVKQTDVYFDDVTMTYTPSRVIQYNEYYPFGLQTSSSWTRDNLSNNFKYNEASELNNTTGWYDLPYRNYDPSIARFMQVDPLAHADVFNSSYNYAGNNPVTINDPSGLKFGRGRPQWLEDLLDEEPDSGGDSFGIIRGGGGGYGGGGSSNSWALADAAWNATPNGSDRTYYNNDNGTFSSYKIEYGAEVAHGRDGNPIAGSERGVNIVYETLIDLKESHDLLSGERNSNFDWNQADNIGDMVSSFVSIPALAGGIAHAEIVAARDLKLLSSVTKYNKVLGAAGKILGVAGLVTSVGVLATEEFSWTNLTKVGINLGSLALKANPVGLTVSLTIGLLDYTGLLDKGLNYIYKENTIK